MTTQNRTRALSLSLLGGMLLCAGGSAHAADFAFRSSLDASSKRSGLGRASVEVLTPRAGRGATAVADELFRKFRGSTSALSTAGTYSVVNRAQRVRYVGDGWYLDVMGDGTAARYRNIKRIDEASDAGFGKSAKMDHATLERLGREFILGTLRGFVSLSTSDQLVASHSAYRVDTIGQEAATAPVQQSFALSTVIFSRTVNSVPVVGPGSKVAVLFDATGAIVGFDFDWATYEATGRTQSALDLTATHTRARSVLPNDPFAAGRTLERLECGYYDGGARRRSSATPIQAACMYHYTSLSRILDTSGAAEDTRAAFAVPLPVGTTVEADAKWPESLALCTGSRLCGTTPVVRAPADSGALPSTPSGD